MQQKLKIKKKSAVNDPEKRGPEVKAVFSQKHL